MTTLPRLLPIVQRIVATVGLHRTMKNEERGASLVEYALLVALIALVCVGAVTFLGATVAPEYSSIADGID